MPTVATPAVMPFRIPQPTTSSVASSPVNRSERSGFGAGVGDAGERTRDRRPDADVGCKTGGLGGRTRLVPRDAQRCPDPLCGPADGARGERRHDRHVHPGWVAPRRAVRPRHRLGRRSSFAGMVHLAQCARFHEVDGRPGCEAGCRVQDIDRDTGEAAPGVHDARDHESVTGRQTAEEASVEAHRTAARHGRARGGERACGEQASERTAEGAVAVSSDREAPAPVGQLRDRRGTRRRSLHDPGERWDICGEFVA